MEIITQVGTVVKYLSLQNYSLTFFKILSAEVTNVTIGIKVHFMVSMEVKSLN